MTDGNERVDGAEEPNSPVQPAEDTPEETPAAEESDDLSAAIAVAQLNLEQQTALSEEVLSEDAMPADDAGEPLLDAELTEDEVPALVDAELSEGAPAPSEEPGSAAAATELPGEAEPSADEPIAAEPAPAEPAETEQADEAPVTDDAAESPDAVAEPASAEVEVDAAVEVPRQPSVSIWPFVIYDAVWLLFAAAIVWQGEQLPPGTAVFESPLYPLAVLGGVMLTIAGPLVILVAWIASWREGVSKGTLFVSALVRGAVATLLGVTLWWGALVLLDQLRLGRLL